MAAGLFLRVHGPDGVAERAFARVPVMIGRNVDPTHCALVDEQVSKLHASLDVQEGTIVVRDAGSTNGTFVRGQRLPPNQWVAVGSGTQPAEVRIARFTIHATIRAVDNQTSSTLAELVRSSSEPGRAAFAPNAALPAGVPQARVVGSEPPRPAEQGPHGPSVVGMPEYVNGVLAAMRELRAAIARELEATPPAERPLLCLRIIREYPAIMDEPSIQALMRSYGWTGAVAAATAEGPMAAAALSAMQDLAGWYTGRNRALSDPRDVIAFKDRLRATLDEFLLGYVPLMAGMNRFESQMAIREGAAAGPFSSPAELATRLLDWRTNSDALFARLRASFAELMMHQVALLNGVMSGVRALLTELAPATIERAAEREPRRLGGIFGRPDPWDVYKKRHSDLADEENERFRILFGQEFVDEYRQFARDARTGELPVIATGPSGPPKR